MNDVFVMRLRAIAAFLEAHPELPTPGGVDVSPYSFGVLAPFDALAALPGAVVHDADTHRHVEWYVKTADELVVRYYACRSYREIAGVPRES